MDPKDVPASSAFIPLCLASCRPQSIRIRSARAEAINGVDSLIEPLQVGSSLRSARGAALMDLARLDVRAAREEHVNFD